MPSRGRSERPRWPLIVVLAGASWLALLGAFATVRAVVEWLT